jgi:hypothetical protein
MKKRANNVPREVNKVKRLTALAVDQALVLGTPVDTGTARSNWIVTLFTATDQTQGAFVPLSKGDMSETGNAQAAMAQGKSAISQAKPGQDIHLTNNLSYIMPLNEGHSAQAPAGFVEEAVEAGRRVVKRARLDTGKRT